MAGRECVTGAGITTGDATAGVGKGVACNNDETVTIGVLAFGMLVATMDGTLLTSGAVIDDDVSTNEPDAFTVTEGVTFGVLPRE